MSKRLTRFLLIYFITYVIDVTMTVYGNSGIHSQKCKYLQVNVPQITLTVSILLFSM